MMTKTEDLKQSGEQLLGRNLDAYRQLSSYGFNTLRSLSESRVKQAKTMQLQNQKLASVVLDAQYELTFASLQILENEVQIWQQTWLRVFQTLLLVPSRDDS